MSRHLPQLASGEADGKSRARQDCQWLQFNLRFTTWTLLCGALEGAAFDLRCESFFFFSRVGGVIGRGSERPSEKLCVVCSSRFELLLAEPISLSKVLFPLRVHGGQEDSEEGFGDLLSRIHLF